MIPATTAVLALTNDWHGLIWRSTTFFPVGKFLAIKVSYGPYFYFQWAYAGLLILAGMILILIDIDHFKKVNDTYGHQVGDQVIQMVAEVFKKNLREVDITGRYGGDEFTLLLPETKCQGAYKVANRMLRLIDHLSVSTTQGNVTITASIGMGTLNENTTSLEDMLRNADEALYRAKQNGRNRVEACSEIVLN